MITESTAVAPPAFTAETGRPDLAAFAYKKMNSTDGAYLGLREAYRGNFQEFMLLDQNGEDLRVDPNQFTANYLRPLIDDLVHALEISNFVVSEEGSDKKASADAVTTFRSAWEQQRMPTRAPIVHRAARIDGDAFCLVWEGDGGPGTCRIDFNSATDMRPFYVPGTDDEVDFVAKRWAVRKGVYRVNLFFADRIEKWIHADETQASTQPSVYGEKWDHWTKFYEDGNVKSTILDSESGEEVETDEDVTDALGQTTKLWPLPNPVGRIPIVVFSNRLDPFSPYGVSDLENAIRVQNALNKLDAGEFLAHEFMTKRARVVLHQDTTGLGGNRTPRDPLRDPEDPHDESGEAKKQEAEEKQQTVNPGDLIDVIGNSLHELSTEEPAGYIASKKEKKADFAVTNGMSLIHILPDQTAISGEAYRRSAMMNLIKKQAARRDFGAAWAQVAELMAFWLDLGDVKFRPEWAHDDSVDISEFWDQVEAKLKLGVPAEQILLEAGYPAALVEAWVKLAEKKAADIAEQMKGNDPSDPAASDDGDPTKTTSANAEEQDTEQPTAA